MTHPLSLRGAALTGVVLAAALLAGPAAHAQIGQTMGPIPGTNAQGTLVGPVEPPRDEVNKTLPAPPAIPGATTPANRAAPMDRPPSDMRPNEALFDAINRGDIASARDAISRGADLHATNVLGLTPTELSVDLGHNDITFLLLSERGSSVNGARPAAVANQAPPAKVAAKAPPRRPAPRPAPAVTAAPPTAMPARQYADVPAAPVPQAGFLGFGGLSR